QSTGAINTVAFPSASTIDEVQQLSVYGAAGTFTVTAYGSTTAPLPFNVAPSGIANTVSLENALNALPPKPSHIPLRVSGWPGRNTTVLLNSNGTKTDRAALVAAGSAGATTAVATLQQGGSNTTSEEQYVNTGTASFTMNFGGAVTASTAISSPV